MKFLISLSLLTLALASSASPPVFPNQFYRHIVGGVEAGKGDFPFIIQLQLSGRHWCGAAILNENWILSAAHCFDYPANLYTVVAGEHDQLRDEGTEQRRSIDQLILHPQYEYDGGIRNDVALVKVNAPFVFNSSFVQPVQLARTGSVPSGNLTVAGWGDLQSSGPKPTVLMRVNVPYVEYEECARSYPLSPGMICAGVGGKDSCQGDSGGPLVSRNNTLVGIVSWGRGCALEGYPGVYADVAYYYNYIQQIIA